LSVVTLHYNSLPYILGQQAAYWTFSGTVRI